MNPLFTRFYTVTFGCKLNQFDSAVIDNNLLKIGWGKAKNEQEAQVFIINSCTVTQKSDHEARKIIHGIKKKYPDSFIVLTGCYSQGNELIQLQKILPEVDLFMGNIGKYHAKGIIEGYETFKSSGSIPQSLQGSIIGSNNRKEIFRLKNSEFSETFIFNPNSESSNRARALVKIQDGCDFRCSYCIVPFVRGNNRSVSPNLILPYLQSLYENGFSEAIFTGIHIGTYGKDIKQKVDKEHSSLLALLEKIEEIDIPIKIRLSSLDCNEISMPLIQFLNQSTKVQPHLHIPLQSGSDGILTRMKRNYNSREFADKVEKIALTIPDINIGTDIIVGFPGETDKDFQKTKELFQSLPISYGHIFSYSKRENTMASKMPNQVEKRIKKERNQILQNISKEKKKNFLFSQNGKNREAIILDSGNSNDHRNSGFKVITDNYLNLILKTTDMNLKSRQKIMVKISSEPGYAILA